VQKTEKIIAEQKIQAIMPLFPHRSQQAGGELSSQNRNVLFLPI
jgi:hypothetical protein